MQNDKGKPSESWGRKAKGLKQLAVIPEKYPKGWCRAETIAGSPKMLINKKGRAFFMKKSILFLAALVITFAFTGTVTLAAASKYGIDSSMAKDGYVTVTYPQKITKIMKVIVQKDDEKYTYDLKSNDEIKYPLQMGTGQYKVTVYENISGTKYKAVDSVSFNVAAIDEKSVYTISNPIINYSKEMISIVELNKLVESSKNTTEKVDTIYNYMISKITYDMDKIKNLKSDYVPVIDEVYLTNKGICYDYSSLFASILRDLNIPTRLVMGYAPNVNGYHAWNQIFIDGKWITTDTTYDAQAKSYKINYSFEKNSDQFKVVKIY